MISSWDLRVVLRELEYLENATLDNFYGDGNELYAFKFRRPGYGTDLIIVDLSVPTFHASSIRPEFPKMPPGKIMNFRKHIKNARVEYAYPEENERIVHILLENGIDVTVELFGGGNIILVKDGLVFMAVKYRSFSAREIKPGARYVLPPGPEKFTPEFTIVRGLVSDLVRRYGVPPKYAKEIAFRAGVDEKAKELSEYERKLVYEAYAEVINEIEESEKGYLYEGLVVSPIELRHLGEPLKEFESFNEALDYAYAKLYEERLKKAVEKKYASAKEKIIKIIRSQESGLSRLRRKLSELESSYEKLSLNLHLVEELLDTINRARKRMDWDEIVEKLSIAKAKGIPAAGIFEDIDAKRGIIYVSIEGSRIPLDIRLNAFENLNRIAEEIKKTRQKISKIEEVLSEKQQELESLNERIALESEVKIERRERRRRTRRYRYENFRWIKFEDALIVAGKDAKTNEILIRRRMEPDDLVFHADYYGAPFVLLKGEKKEKYIKEAALMAGVFSRARKDGLNYVSVYYVKPEQVSLGAPHGQYVARGAFVIRGKRNYIDVVLRWGVGRNVRGSPERIKESSDSRIILAPGGSQKEFTEARKIALKLTGYDWVVPAGSRIVEKKNITY